jgi:hypothetical protein
MQNYYLHHARIIAAYKKGLLKQPVGKTAFLPVTTGFGDILKVRFMYRELPDGRALVIRKKD